MAAGYRIEFESWFGVEGDGFRAQGWVPFKLVAQPDGGDPNVRHTFGVWYAGVSLEYETFRQKIGGDSLDLAAVRWALGRLEDQIRLGRLLDVQTKQTQKIILDQAGLEFLKRMVLVKTCDYQLRDGRQLYCSAAHPKDSTRVGSRGLRLLAPTSAPICKACNLPDTDFLCSNFSHPRVTGSESIGFSSRQVVGAYCEAGHHEEVKNAARCRAGGYPCWTRVVEPQLRLAPAVPYSPRDLPVALDFLDAVWKQAFGQQLLRFRSVEKIAALSWSCATADEFKSRLADLSELFKSMEVSDALLSVQVDKAQTFNRMLGALAGCGKTSVSQSII